MCVCGCVCWLFVFVCFVSVRRVGFLEFVLLFASLWVRCFDFGFLFVVFDLFGFWLGSYVLAVDSLISFGLFVCVLVVLFFGLVALAAFDCSYFDLWRV